MSIRVLHVVGGMNQRGVETWLMHVLRHIDRSRYPMDFLVHTEQECAYDAEIRALGARIISCMHPSQPIRYAQNLGRVLREEGPYDIVHSHVHHFTGYVLTVARTAGVPKRIAHSHNDTRQLNSKAGMKRRAYLALMKRLIGLNATDKLAASRDAAVALYGPGWTQDPKARVLYYGIDLAPFEQPVDRQEMRRELGIPANALVIGNVARFHEQKNHRFLIQIAAEVIQQEPRAHLLLVGDGPLRPEIELQAREAGIQAKVTYAGLRGDVPRVMKGAMDVFVMPSLYEGLGLVLVEAQAAGIPSVISHVIPEDVEIVPTLLQRLSLTDSAAKWADVALKAAEGQSKVADSIQQLKASPFTIQTCVAQLETVYRG